MTPERLGQMIRDGESLDVEFKGEEREPLSDSALVETVVCLANRPGGGAVPAFARPGVSVVDAACEGREAHTAGNEERGLV